MQRRMQVVFVIVVLFLLIGRGGALAHGYEVYLGMVNTWMVRGWYEPVPHWLVMFSDGSFYYDLPLEGLQNFDRTKSKIEESEYWGVYQIHGSTGIWKRADYGEEAVKIDSQGNILLMGTTYYRLNSVDGKKLDGSWTYYANPSDVWDHPDQDKPILTFSDEGRFADYGLFKADYLPIPEYYDDDGYSVPERAVAPGQGSYEIRDFTLILNYDDGRIRRAGFTLFYGDAPEESPVLIYVYRGGLRIMD